MGKMCYLCRRKSSKSDQISLHRFPTSPEIREKWLHVCDLSTEDDLTCIFICSLHFTDDDVQRVNLHGQTRLKSGAVPSKNVINSLNIDAPSSNDVSNVLDRGIISLTNIPESLDTNREPSPVTNKISGTCTSNDNKAVNSEANTAPTNQICGECIKQHGLSCTVENNVEYTNDEVVHTTPTKKRRYFEPRYVSEITIFDIATPKSAQRILQLVKATDKKKSKHIEILQDQNRKLRQCIVTLAETIANLKQKDLESTVAGNALLEADYSETSRIQSTKKLPG